MKRQRLISKGALSRVFEQAAAKWRQQDYQGSILLLERASRQDPGNTGLLLDLGRAYGMRYLYPEAERTLEKAVFIAPRRAEALAEAGRRAQEFGHYEMATRYFERASKESDASANVFVTLSELYERGHRMVESGALVERALVAQPDHAGGRLVQARLNRLAGAL